MPYDVFLVFFDYDSVAIPPDAAAILDRVAETYRPLSHCRLNVASHTDRIGRADYNLSLSRRRAHAVVDYLRQRGVQAVPHIEAFGESRSLVETGDGVAERHNRRVEIVIGPLPR